MTSVSSFFQTVRYDLNDFNKQEYGDDYLLICLNRTIKILDSELMRLHSDWTATSSDVTLTSGTNQMGRPSNCSTIRYIYINQVYKRELSLDSVKRMQILNTSTGEPSFWSQFGAYVEWDRTADQDYTCNIIYDKWTGTLTTSSDMPFSSEYDDYILQGLSIIASASKKKEINPVDQQVHSLFRSVLERDVIARNFKRRPYKMDY